MMKRIAKSRPGVVPSQDDPKEDPRSPLPPFFRDKVADEDLLLCVGSTKFVNYLNIQGIEKSKKRKGVRRYSELREEQQKVLVPTPKQAWDIVRVSSELAVLVIDTFAGEDDGKIPPLPFFNIRTGELSEGLDFGRRGRFWRCARILRPSDGLPLIAAGTPGSGSMSLSGETLERGIVAVWDCSTGRIVAEKVSLLSGDLYSSVCVPQSAVVLSGGTGSAQTLQAFDVSKDSISKAKMEGGSPMQHDGVIYQMRASPENHLVFIAGGGSSVQIWSAKPSCNFGLISRIPVGHSFTYAMAFNEDNMTLVAAGGKQICCYDLRMLRGGSSARGMAVSPVTSPLVVSSSFLYSISHISGDLFCAGTTSNATGAAIFNASKGKKLATVGGIGTIHEVLAPASPFSRWSFESVDLAGEKERLDEVLEWMTQVSMADRGVLDLNLKILGRHDVGVRGCRCLLL